SIVSRAYYLPQPMLPARMTLPSLHPYHTSRWSSPCRPPRPILRSHAPGLSSDFKGPVAAGRGESPRVLPLCDDLGIGPDPTPRCGRVPRGGRFGSRGRRRVSRPRRTPRNRRDGSPPPVHRGPPARGTCCLPGVTFAQTGVGTSKESTAGGVGLRRHRGGDPRLHAP